MIMAREAQTQAIELGSLACADANEWVNASIVTTLLAMILSLLPVWEANGK